MKDQKASAARMREIRAAKLQVAEASNTEASSASGSTSTSPPEPSTTTPVKAEEECVPESSDSENERPGTDSGVDDEDFDPQVAFDNWIVSQIERCCLCC